MLLRRSLLIGAGLMLCIAPAAQGQAQTFACTQATAGQLSCQAGIACACSFFQASAMEGTPAGWRWDCGVLRPRCAENRPATIGNYGYAIPDSLSITEQSVGVNVNQSNEQVIEWIAPVTD